MAWHDTKFQDIKIWRGWDTPGTNPKCDGWTKKVLRMCDSTEVVRVRDILDLIASYLDGERRSSWMVRLMDTVYRQVPEEIRRSAVAFIAFNIDRFPTPWISLPNRYRAIEWVQRTAFTNAFAELTEKPGLSLIEFTAQDPLAVGKYRVAIDWSWGDTAIVGNFKKWLRHRRLQKATRESGGRPLEPYASLKRLSAFRLDQAGYDFGDAMQLMEKMKEDKGHGDVLPTYGSRGRWSTEVKRAEAELAKFGNDGLFLEG